MNIFVTHNSIYWWRKDPKAINTDKMHGQNSEHNSDNTRVYIKKENRKLKINAKTTQIIEFSQWRRKDNG